MSLLIHEIRIFLPSSSCDAEGNYILKLCLAEQHLFQCWQELFLNTCFQVEMWRALELYSSSSNSKEELSEHSFITLTLSLRNYTCLKMSGGKAFVLAHRTQGNVLASFSLLVILQFKKRKLRLTRGDPQMVFVFIKLHREIRKNPESKPSHCVSSAISS